MARQSSNERDSVPHDFYSVRSDLDDKLNNLLASMDPKARAALEMLAKADAATRATVLAGVDPAKRSTIELILNMMKKP